MSGSNPKSDTIRVSNKYKPGDYMSEDDFENLFKRIKGNPSTFPQYSVQDYSRVKSDKKGNYINKL